MHYSASRLKPSLIALSVFLLFGCGGGGGGADNGNASAQPFQFTMMSAIPYHIQVVDSNGAPLDKVSILLSGVIESADPYRNPDLADTPPGNESFANALSNSNGNVKGILALTNTHQSVDVVVFKAGWAGDYSVPALRQAWGLTAPAYRVTVPLAMLNGWQVVLHPTTGA